MFHFETRIMLLLIIFDRISWRFANLFDHNTKNSTWKHESIWFQKRHIKTFLNCKMFNEPIFYLRITLFNHFKYNKHTLNVVNLMRKFLFDQIVDFLTRTIRNSRPHEGLINLRDAIHRIIVIKTFYYLQFSVIAYLSQHFFKKKIVLGTVLCMNQLPEKLKIIPLISWSLPKLFEYMESIEKMVAMESTFFLEFF